MHQKKHSLLIIFVLMVSLFIPSYGITKCKKPSDTEAKSNPIPPRFQWNNNSGYCGEVCLISAGLYYGQYISQYDARAIATDNDDQSTSQLLLGKNDQYAATQMHLNSIEWNSKQEQATPQFLEWVKQNVLQGYPVAIGLFTNEYLFYDKTNPNAGDKQYDHIVPVIGIGSNHPLNDPNYYGNDIIYFSDNGLWGDARNPPYFFNSTFGSFQATRRQANAKNGSVYSLSNNGTNYGIAITGIMDVNGDTLPVRVDTDLNYESPEIVDGTTDRPSSMPLNLTITIQDLQPHMIYNLYRYNDLSKVPDSNFNANKANAYQSWQISNGSQTSYTMTQLINSDEMAIYRAVEISAP